MSNHYVVYIKVIQNAMCQLHLSKNGGKDIYKAKKKPYS